MSNATIQQVMRRLQDLPESEQGVVLDFLGALKQKHAVPRSPGRRRRNPAVKNIGAALVFTGKIANSDINWLEQVREERHQHILRPQASHASLA